MQGHLQSLAAFSHCPSVVVTVPQIIIMTRRECKDNLSDVVPPVEWFASFMQSSHFVSQLAGLGVVISHQGRDACSSGLTPMEPESSGQQ